MAKFGSGKTRLTNGQNCQIFEQTYVARLEVTQHAVKVPASQRLSCETMSATEKVAVGL